jgi:hypothetical protein
MSRSYRLLTLAVLAVAVLVVVAGRSRSHGAAPSTGTPAAPVALLQRAVPLDIRGAAVLPQRVAVPKGAVVTLRVTNHDAASRRFAVLGYEGAVAPAVIAPGAAETLRFAADRPGSDFAWLVDGRPAGVFAVEGSHLVEGHR